MDIPTDMDFSLSYYPDSRLPCPASDLEMDEVFLWTLAAVVISGLFIYLFNRRMLRQNTFLREYQSRKLAVILAIFTAPWLFFLPAFRIQNVKAICGGVIYKHPFFHVGLPPDKEFKIIFP